MFSHQLLTVKLRQSRFSFQRNKTLLRRSGESRDLQNKSLYSPRNHIWCTSNTWCSAFIFAVGKTLWPLQLVLLRSNWGAKHHFNEAITAFHKQLWLQQQRASDTQAHICSTAGSHTNSLWGTPCCIDPLKHCSLHSSAMNGEAGAPKWTEVHTAWICQHDHYKT